MNKLRDYRKAHNYTMDDVAKLMGVHPSTIYSWESEKSRPHAYQLKRLAELFGCEESDLGIVPYDRYHPKQAPQTVNAVAATLYERFTQLTLDQQRWIAAYLSPDPYRLTVKKLREGLITDDDAELVRKMMEKCV